MFWKVYIWHLFSLLFLVCGRCYALPYAQSAAKEEFSLSNDTVKIYGMTYDLKELYAAIQIGQTSSTQSTNSSNYQPLEQTPSHFQIPGSLLAATIFNPQPSFKFDKADLNNCLNAIFEMLSKQVGMRPMKLPERRVCEPVAITITPLEMYTAIAPIFIHEALVTSVYLRDFLERYNYYQTMYLLIWRSDKVIGSFDITNCFGSQPCSIVIENETVTDF